MTKVTELKYASITEWLKDQSDKKDLHGALLKLRQLIKDKKERWNDLTWWHNVGTCVAQFLPKEDRHKGDNVIELLANALQPGRELKDWTLPHVLYRARDFVDKYKNRKDAEALGRKRNAKNKPLTRLHVSVLLTANDDQREKFLAACLKNSWSAQELRRQIQNATGRKGTGGRPPKPPTYSSAGVVLRDITVMANRWTAYHKVWFIGWKAPRRSIRAQDQDNDTLHEIKKAKEGLESVRDNVEEALKKVESLEIQLKSKLSAGSTTHRAKSRRSS